MPWSRLWGKARQPGADPVRQQPRDGGLLAGATKAGAVVVNTMPMLRAGELTAIVDKAEISHALCDTRLMEELVLCERGSALSEDGGGL
jgi:hypothetical protein